SRPERNWRATACADAYGVAGSCVVPTTRIGGASGAAIGPILPTGAAGQPTHGKSSHAVDAPKRGAACAAARATVSSSPTRRGPGASMHPMAYIAAVELEYFAPGLR